MQGHVQPCVQLVDYRVQSHNQRGWATPLDVCVCVCVCVCAVAKKKASTPAPGGLAAALGGAPIALGTISIKRALSPSDEDDEPAKPAKVNTVCMCVCVRSGLPSSAGIASTQRTCDWAHMYTRNLFTAVGN